MDNVIIVQFPKYFNVMIEEIILKDNIRVRGYFHSEDSANKWKT